MAYLLSIVNQQQAPIDEEKLRISCTRQNIWDHFGLAREDISALSEAKQLQMLRKFCFDLLPTLSSARLNAFNIDLSIGSAIRNSAGLTMTKLIESEDERSEMTVSIVNGQEKFKKSINLWENFGHFGTESCDFSIEKANLPENTVFYINQAYQSFKDGKKVYYTHLFIISQIMPLAHQPKHIESNELKDDEVKILRTSYDPISGEFLGIEYCIALITGRNYPQEQFFDYGYNKENAKVLYSTRKLKIPNCFKSTIFRQHRMQYEGGAFDEQKCFDIYFYLPSTLDRNEKINKYLSSVDLKPFAVNPLNFGEGFNPADPDFDRSVVVSFIKRKAQQSSQNLKGNADAFLSTVAHDNDKLLWPDGKRAQNDKFALTY